jgi:hypothetical protein
LEENEPGERSESIPAVLAPADPAEASGRLTAESFQSPVSFFINDFLERNENENGVVHKNNHKFRLSITIGRC